LLQRSSVVDTVSGRGVRLAGAHVTDRDVQRALQALARGEMIIVFDDVHRENEGDFVIAGQYSTPQTINHMITNGRGLLCVPADVATLTRLGIGPMPGTAATDAGLNTLGQGDAFSTAFMETIDLADSARTGLSAEDRAACIRHIAASTAEPGDFRKPGHVFPLAARDGGLAVRKGHTEAAIELCRLAGLSPVAAICEIINPDGTMARLPELQKIAESSGMVLISIADILKYTNRSPSALLRLSEANLPTKYGTFLSIVYGPRNNQAEYVILAMGNIHGRRGVLVRIHSACVTGDLFGSLKCDCGQQLDLALQHIAENGEGVLIYCLAHEGRGIGIAAKLAAYKLQDDGLDTVEANTHLGYHFDERDYSGAISILGDLGVSNIRLMTNNPLKASAVTSSPVGLETTVPLAISPTSENSRYLQTKRDRLGHSI
jgi:3,4-dihydroxy 2-butanone 4-phosphate synthase / GTP cyclohydrolase II